MISFRKMLAIFSAGIFFIFLDRLLKVFALNLDDYLRILGDIFVFEFAKNYNIAFSVPFGGPFLNWVVIFIIIFLSYFLWQFFKEGRVPDFFFLLLVILGAISNLFDRLRYGYVIDYFGIQGFTIFNLADAMIVAGVIYFIFFSKTLKLK